MVTFPNALDREQLQRLLAENRFDSSAYSLVGGHPNEAYVLDQRGPEWAVYYSERGLETGLTVFPTEALACRHLADLLWRDATTRT